jgi:hypothetical protein
MLLVLLGSKLWQHQQRCQQQQCWQEQQQRQQQQKHKQEQRHKQQWPEQCLSAPVLQRQLSGQQLQQQQHMVYRKLATLVLLPLGVLVVLRFGQGRTTAVQSLASRLKQQQQHSQLPWAARPL